MPITDIDSLPDSLPWWRLCIPTTQEPPSESSGAVQRKHQLQKLPGIAMSGQQNEIVLMHLRTSLSCLKVGGLGDPFGNLSKYEPRRSACPEMPTTSSRLPDRTLTGASSAIGTLSPALALLIGFGKLRQSCLVLHYRFWGTNMAISNLERYKKDLKSLIDDGNQLHMAMQKECFPTEFAAQVKAV